MYISGGRKIFLNAQVFKILIKKYRKMLIILNQKIKNKKITQLLKYLPVPIANEECKFSLTKREHKLTNSPSSAQTRRHPPPPKNQITREHLYPRPALKPLLHKCTQQRKRENFRRWESGPARLVLLPLPLPILLLHAAIPLSFQLFGSSSL